MIVGNSLVPKHAGSPCPYCNTVMAADPICRQPSRDHITPRARGGPDKASNIIIVCRKCNGDKSDRILAEFYGWLRVAGDPRAEVISDLIHSSCGDDRALLADFYADSGAWIVRNGYARKRAPRLKKACDVAWSVMHQLKVPRTHWSFAPPDQVKVLARSQIHVIRYRDPHRLLDQVGELLGVAA